ncbi:MAG: GFA family protein, partial [Woeseiaceae bacterium]
WYAMSHKYEGGCDHVHTHSDKDPVDNHTCHCSVCKRVTGQDSTHVVFFKHGDVKVDKAANLKRQPFNDQNPNGPLELCTCKDCGTPIMLDDKQRRIRVIVPNLMGYDADMPPTYHAFFDAKSGAKKPKDGRPVYEGLRPDFVWPVPA